MTSKEIGRSQQLGTYLPLLGIDQLVHGETRDYNTV
jgi:hypothetical protein